MGDQAISEEELVHQLCEQNKVQYIEPELKECEQ